MKLHIPRSSSASAPPSRISIHLPSATMEAPPPCPPPPPPPTAGENIILCTAAALPVILGFFPILMYLVTGSVEKAMKMFRMPTMAAALTNSLAWLFYSLVVQRVDPSWMDVTTANAFLLMMNYNFIMLVWADKRSVFKGILLSVIVLPGVTYLFVAMRWQLVLPNAAHNILGMLGILSQLGCYTLQVWDSVNGQDGWEAAVTAINFFPSMILNFCVGYVTWVYHPEQFFLWISSVINCVACTMGLMMLVLKVLKDCCKRRQEAANDNNNNENSDPESGLRRREYRQVRNNSATQLFPLPPPPGQSRAERSEISRPATSREPELPLRPTRRTQITADATNSASPPPAPSSPADGSILSLEAIAAVSALSDEYKRSRKQANEVGKSTSQVRRKKTLERSKEYGNEVGKSTSHECRKKTIERAEKSRKQAPAVGTRAGWFCTPALRRRVPATRDQVIIV